MSRTFVGLASLVCAAIVVVAIVCIGNSDKSFDPSIVQKAVGDYENFRIKRHIQPDVLEVVVSTHNPRAFIKAMQDAVNVIEEKTEKKVVNLEIGGFPTRIFLALQEDPSQ